MGAAKDIGPLDWRAPIVDGSGRPSPEFQRRWNTQRGNNGLIGVTLGTGAPLATPAPADGAEYVNISTTPYTVYFGKGGSWHKAGAAAFTDLSDAPRAYTGAAGELVQVNGGASGVQFSTLSAVLDSLGAIEGDILYRGASGWAALLAGVSGDILVTGGVAGAPSWETISAVLDGISNMRGSVLYRGASGWAALGPGAAGQVLQTGGAGADPSWVAQSGGGGGGGVSPTLRGSNLASSAAVSSVTVPWPSGTLAGDLAVIVIGGNWQMASTPAAGWSVVYNVGTGQQSAGVIAKALSSSDITAGSVVVSMAGVGDVTYGCITFVGATTGITGFANNNNASTGTGTSGFVSLAAFNGSTDKVIYFGTIRGNATVTCSQGTLQHTSTSGNLSSGAIYYGTPSGPAPIYSTFTYSISQYQSEVAIKVTG